jgi:hypothetical protein
LVIKIVFISCYERLVLIMFQLSIIVHFFLNFSYILELDLHHELERSIARKVWFMFLLIIFVHFSSILATFWI